MNSQQNQGIRITCIALSYKRQRFCSYVLPTSALTFYCQIYHFCCVIFAEIFCAEKKGSCNSQKTRKTVRPLFLFFSSLFFFSSFSLLLFRTEPWERWKLNFYKTFHRLYKSSEFLQTSRRRCFSVLRIKLQCHFLFLRKSYCDTAFDIIR